jgi:hypothetical protein
MLLVNLKFGTLDGNAQLSWLHLGDFKAAANPDAAEVAEESCSNQSAFP